jgi:hypothetical protein
MLGDCALPRPRRTYYRRGRRVANTPASGHLNEFTGRIFRTAVFLGEAHC